MFRMYISLIAFTMLTACSDGTEAENEEIMRNLPIGLIYLTREECAGRIGNRIAVDVAEEFTAGQKQDVLLALLPTLGGDNLVVEDGKHNHGPSGVHNHAISLSVKGHDQNSVEIDRVEGGKAVVSTSGHEHIIDEPNHNQVDGQGVNDGIHKHEEEGSHQHNRLRLRLCEVRRR